MGKSSFDKWLVTLALLIVSAGVVFHLVKSDRALQSQKQKQPGAQSDFAESYNFHPNYLPSVPRPTNGELDPVAGPEKLPREKVEAWLAKHNRNAMSLLAAFRALDDTNYLNEAATNFPNNPQVELAVLARDEFPADRHKWLDLFKASSPSNSLANYLSAEDDFKTGKSEEAVQELLAASDKSQFDNYAMEAQLVAEELHLDSGKSPREAATFAMSDMAESDMPELATIKRADQGIADLMQQKLSAGDTGSAVNLAQMGMILADKLNSGGGGTYIINQLVGMATEAIVLQHLDQNTAYDFLGGQTPGQVLQTLKQQKAAIRELVTDFQAAYPDMTDPELNNYIQLSKTHGEAAAMQWVVQQHPPANPAK